MAVHPTVALEVPARDDDADHYRPTFAFEHLMLALAAITLWLVVLPAEFIFAA
jgi:hypothetical protein